MEQDVTLLERFTTIFEVCNDYLDVRRDRAKSAGSAVRLAELASLLVKERASEALGFPDNARIAFRAIS